MELRQIRYFLEVADTLNFSRAAENLHISQQPLNRQIHALERELGYRLFCTNTRSVRLTRAGEVFKTKASRGLEMLDQAKLLSGRIAEGEAGSFHIEYFPEAIFGKLPQCVAGYKRNYPGVNVTMTTNNRCDIFDMKKHIDDETCDLGVAITFDDPPEGLECAVLERNETVVAIPRSNPLAKRESLRLRELSNIPMLSYPARIQPEISSFMQKLCDREGIRVHVVETSESHLALLGLVAAGLGATMSIGTMRHEFEDQIAYVPLADQTPAINTVLLWKTGLELRAVENFLRIARLKFRQ